MKKLIFLLLLVISIYSFGQSVDGGLKTLTASGTDTYTITEALPAAYDPKERFIVSFANPNTITTPTLNRAALGAKFIKNADGTNPSVGAITGRVLLSYNGTYYQIVGGGGSAGGGSGTVTNVAALTLGTTGTDLSSSVANPTTTPVITLNVPTASGSNRGALSASDWSTFNGKQATGLSYLLASGGTATGTNTFAMGAFPFIMTTGVTTGTGATAGHQLVGNSLTTGNLFDASSSSVSSGALGVYTSTSTVINHTEGTNGLVKVLMSGANSTASKTAIGIFSKVINTGTTNTNIAAYLEASGGSTNLALRTLGSVFIANASGDTPTASTRLDVRGTGTTTNLIQRWADATNTLRASIKDNGQFIVEFQGDDVEGLTYGSSGSNRISLMVNSFSSLPYLQGYNGAGARFRIGMASSTEFQITSFNASGVNLRNDGGDASVTRVANLITGSVNNSIAPLTAVERIVLNSSIKFTNSVNTANIKFIKWNGEINNTSFTTVTNSGIEISPNINLAGGTTQFIGYDYNPTLTSITGLTHIAFRSTSGRLNFTHTEADFVRFTSGSTTPVNVRLVGGSGGAPRTLILQGGSSDNSYLGNEGISGFRWQNDGIVLTGSAFSTETVTANTRLDVRGTGTTTNKTFRTATSTDIQTFEILDNANINALPLSGSIMTLGGGATASELRFLEPSGSGTNYLGFKVPALAGNLDFTWFDAYPAVNGYVLSATTAGVMSWIAPGGGGSGLTYAQTKAIAMKIK